MNLYQSPDISTALGNFRDYLYSQRGRDEFIVVLDGAESLSDEQYKFAIATAFNFKAVRALIFTTRRAPQIPQTETLLLAPLAQADATELLKALLPAGPLSAELVSQVTDAANGYPLALRILALRALGAALFANFFRVRYMTCRELSRYRLPRSQLRSLRRSSRRPECWWMRSKAANGYSCTFPA